MKDAKATTDLILESMRAEVDQFVAEHDDFPSATAYEDKVLDIARKFAAQLISQGGGDRLPKDRNAKKK
jgi:hypothetical protein